MKAFAEEMQRRVNLAQDWMTTECKAEADFFTPMDSGDLRREIGYTINEHGAKDGWYYKSPYARRQWWGVTKDGRDFNYNVVVAGKKGERKGSNPNARSRWTEHAADNIRDRIIAGVKRILAGEV